MMLVGTWKDCVLLMCKYSLIVCKGVLNSKNLYTILYTKNEYRHYIQTNSERLIFREASKSVVIVNLTFTEL